MYMYAEGTVKFGEGSESVFGEADGYESVEDVEQYALSLIQQDEERSFSIQGTLVTDYSNLNFRLNYDGMVCTLSETDYYWWHGYDDGVWGEGDPEEQLESFCGNYGIKPGTPSYESLKKAFEARGRYIFSNDDHTEFYAEVPYGKPVTIHRKGDPIVLSNGDGEEETESADDDAFWRDLFGGVECNFCHHEYDYEEVVRKRSPEGVVVDICKQCSMVHDLSDWETVEDE